MPALRKIQSNNLINPYNLSPVFGDRELDKIAGKVCKWGSHALRFRQWSDTHLLPVHNQTSESETHSLELLKDM